MTIIVRTEEEKDFRRVEEVTREAFSYSGRIERGGIGSPYEHWMVHELRKRDGVKDLSIVAEVEGELVGHLICSDAYIETPDKTRIHVLNMGPVSVLPQYQRQGVGKSLLRTMIKKAAQSEYGAIVFFGRPEYYPQFGFVEAKTYGITDRNGENFPAFMAMELTEGYLAKAKGGKYYESDIYDESIHAAAVMQFDRSFLGTRSS